MASIAERLKSLRRKEADAERHRKLSRPKSLTRKEWAEHRDRYEKKIKFLEEHKDPNPPPKDGVGTFDGKPVAAWWVPILTAARKSGKWKGGLNSGYRTPEYSEQLCMHICGHPTCPGRCAGRTTNHSKLDESAAVDVSDPAGFQAYLRSAGRPEHCALGSADPWHHSKSGR